MNENIHSNLLNLGFKITSSPDHLTRDDINVTIYEKKGTTIIIEEPDQEKIVNTINRNHPVTGDVTPEQASKLLFEQVAKRDRG